MRRLRPQLGLPGPQARGVAVLRLVAHLVLHRLLPDQHPVMAD